MIPRRNNWQRCYADALENLKEELQRQRIRRRQVQETKDDPSRLTSKTKTYEIHLGPDPEPHRFNSERSCLPPRKQSTLTTIARKDLLKEDLNEEISVGARHETQQYNDLEVERSESEDRAKQEPQSEEDSEENDLSSHWSNSQVSVTRLNSTLDDLLHGLSTTTHLTPFSNPPKEKASHGDNTESIEQQNEDDYTLKAVQAVPLKQPPLGQDATPGRQMTKDIQETWNLMNALRQKIADVQNVIESNV